MGLSDRGVRKLAVESMMGVVLGLILIILLILVIAWAF